MSAENIDPADAIAQALFRVRVRVRRRPHPEGAPHPHHPPHAHHGAPPWVSRMSGIARMRMLDVLSASGDPLSVSALGERIGVDQPRASRLVQEGVERGFVRREADPADARRTRIALTDEGRAFAQNAHGERRQALRSALDGFTADEARELARLLTKLADNWPA